MSSELQARYTDMVSCDSTTMRSLRLQQLELLYKGWKIYLGHMNTAVHMTKIAPCLTSKANFPALVANSVVQLSPSHPCPGRVFTDCGFGCSHQCYTLGNGHPLPTLPLLCNNTSYFNHSRCHRSCNRYRHDFIPWYCICIP